MKGKMYESSGTDVELVEAMLDNLEELLIEYNNVEAIDEVTKSISIGKLKFAKKYISSFATQL